MCGPGQPRSAVSEARELTLPASSRRSRPSKFTSPMAGLRGGAAIARGRTRGGLSRTQPAKDQIRHPVLLKSSLMRRRHFHYSSTFDMSSVP